MHYVRETGIDRLNAEDYKTSYVIVDSLTEEQQEEVRRVASAETPPCAKNRAAVRGNCQGWAYRVLGRLCERGCCGGEG